MTTAPSEKAVTGPIIGRRSPALWLDQTPQLCRIPAMSNEDEHRGPIVWTGLYAVSIVSTVVVLLLHDEWTEVGIRTWSPIAQALLTAAAIIAAFYVQAWKREGDRRMAAADVQAVIIAVTDYLEHHTLKLRGHAKAGALSAQRIKISMPGYQGALKTLEGIDLGLLPHRKAMTKFLGILNDYRGLSGVYFHLIETLPVGGVTSTTRLDNMYERMFKKRSDLLKMFGSAPEKWRVDP